MPRCHVVDASHHRRRRRREPDPSKLLPSLFFYHAHAEPGSSPSLSSMAAISLCVTSATAPPLGRPRVSPATSPTSFLSSSCTSHRVLEFTPPCFTVAPSTAIGAAVTQPLEVRFVDEHCRRQSCFFSVLIECACLGKMKCDCLVLLWV